MANRSFVLFKYSNYSVRVIRRASHLQNPRQISLVNKFDRILCNRDTCKVRKVNFSEENVDWRTQYSVHTDELKEIISENKVSIIDVRSQEEIVDYGKITTQNWMNVPLDEIDSALKLPQKDFLAKYGMKKPNKYSDDIIFYCQRGGRSLAALQTALDQGYFRAKHYPLGWIGWVKSHK